MPEIKYVEYKADLSRRVRFEDQFVKGTVESIMPAAVTAVNNSPNKVIIGVRDQEDGSWTIVSRDQPIAFLRPLKNKGKGDMEAFVLVEPSGSLPHVMVDGAVMKRLAVRYALESGMVEEVLTKGLYLSDRCYHSGLEPHNGKVRVFDHNSNLGAGDTRFALKA